MNCYRLLSILLLTSHLTLSHYLALKKNHLIRKNLVSSNQNKIKHGNNTFECVYKLHKFTQPAATGKLKYKICCILISRI